MYLICVYKIECLCTHQPKSNHTQNADDGTVGRVNIIIVLISTGKHLKFMKSRSEASNAGSTLQRV